MCASVLLAILLVSAAADDPLEADPVTLIGRLGTGSFDERVAAIKALERLGQSALPALRAAANTSDPRVRTRVRALVDSIGRQIETDRFARPTLVGLHFRNRPLGEVVAALNQRHDFGLSLRLGPASPRGFVEFRGDQTERLKALEDRLITLESEQPLPFWEALDRLCQAGSLAYDVSPMVRFGVNPGTWALMADRTGRGPAFDSGPFRVQIQGVRTIFEQDFTLDPALRKEKAEDKEGAPDVGNLNVKLVVLSEPGLKLYSNGAVIVTEATDDRGQSLLRPVLTESRATQENAGAVQSYGGGGVSLQANVALVAPDPPGRVVRRLRGRVPVIAVARGASPLVIPLNGDGLAERSVSIRDAVIIVDEVSLAPGAQASVQVTIRRKRGPLADVPRNSTSDRPDLATFHIDRALEHLELHDAAGRRLVFSAGGQTRGADSDGFYDRYRLIVSPNSVDAPVGVPGAAAAKPAPVPAELRYYGFVQAVSEVPFDFQEIPMP